MIQKIKPPPWTLFTLKSSKVSLRFLRWSKSHFHRGSVAVSASVHVPSTVWLAFFTLFCKKKHDLLICHFNKSLLNLNKSRNHKWSVTCTLFKFLPSSKSSTSWLSSTATGLRMSAKKMARPTTCHFNRHMWVTSCSKCTLHILIPVMICWCH